MSNNFLTKAQAAAKFGDLITGYPVAYYLEFETLEGTYKPEFNFYLQLIGYRLERKRK